MEKTRRRREILSAAARVFAARGYHQASVSDILEEAGIARGTFYLYFRSKRAVFGELIDRFLVEVQSRVRRVEMGPGSPTPYEQLAGNVSRILALVREERDVAVMALNHAVGLDRESDRKLREFYDRMATALRRALEAGMRAGLVSVGDPEIAARLLLGGAKEVVDHVVVRGRARREHGALASEILAVGLRGVAEGSLRDLVKSPRASSARGRKRKRGT